MTNIMEKQFYRQRKDFDLSCIERDKKLTMPEGVEYTENIAYTKDGNPSHQLDISSKGQRRRSSSCDNQCSWWWTDHRKQRL